MTSDMMESIDALKHTLGLGLYNIYTPLLGQPPVYRFRNRDITGIKKLYIAISFLNPVISLPKYGQLRRFYLEGGQFSLHL